MEDLDPQRGNLRHNSARYRRDAQFLDHIVLHFALIVAAAKLLTPIYPVYNQGSMNRN
jgi:hypothetical protein